MLKYDIYTTNGLPTISGEKTKKLSISKPDKGSAISISTTTDDDLEIDEYCLCGYFKVFKILPKSAWLCLIFDTIFAILTIQSQMTFTFIPLFFCSIIILYTTTRGVRKELKELVRFGVYIMLIKLMCLVLLMIGVVVYLKELGLQNVFKNPSRNILLCIFIILGLHLLTLLIQFYLTYRAIVIIHKRDLIYIIPAAHGSIRMRPNLQLVVERLKNQNLGVQMF